MRSSRPAPALIIAVGLLVGANILLAVTGWWLSTKREPDRKAGATIKLLAQDLADNVRPLDVSESAAGQGDALTRPAFSPSRRPFQPLVVDISIEPDALIAEEIAPLDYSLAGVLIHAGQRRALLRKSGDSVGNWISEGEEIDGWRLTDVDVGQVTLITGDRRVTLNLYALEP